MCLICIQWNKNKDLREMGELIENAVKEPNSIPSYHLAEVIHEFNRLSNLSQLVDMIVTSRFPKELLK